MSADEKHRLLRAPAQADARGGYGSVLPPRVGAAAPPPAREISMSALAGPCASTSTVASGQGGGGASAHVTNRVESANYAPPDSAVSSLAGVDSGKQRRLRAATALRWVLNAIIGIFIALVAVLVTVCTGYLTDLRFKVLYAVIEKEKAGDAPFGSALTAFLAVSLAYVLLVAAGVVFIEPVAAGSGISEVKCVLNGVLLPRVLRFKTLLVKVAGNMLSVASGLPVGREGPMIHTGAIAASGITQGKSTTLGFDTRWSVYRAFRNGTFPTACALCHRVAPHSLFTHAPPHRSTRRQRKA
ncbi:hypothetical protein EON66_05200 [archaeon]|nr:MAG: hypothetical protein EON66_05200 [archaeon]